MKARPSPEQIRLAFNYDPLTGSLTWADRGPESFQNLKDYRRFCTRYVGEEAGSLAPSGYYQVKHGGVLLKKHHLIWAWVYGVYPTEQIDHEDHDRGNNRLGNLRPVTHSENMKNKTKYKGRDLPTGVRANGNKFLAKIHHQGETFHLGTFDTLDAAHAARLTAQSKLNFHPNHGT